MKLVKPENDLWKLIKLFPNKDWDWNCISINPSITFEIILDNPDKPWNWYFVSLNPNITWKIIQDNLDKGWIWNNTYYNPNNPSWNWNIIKGHLDVYWNSYLISEENLNITFNIIYDNPNKPWDWGRISYNTFNYNKKINIYKNQAARIIQHQAKIWLYSAPKGPMFLKMVNELQQDGYLLK